MNLCECGCGFPLPKARKRKRPTPRFIKGHNFRQRSLPDKACETCGKVYHALYADQRFCSQGCYAPSRSAGARKPRLERVCAVCGSTFSVKPYRSRAKFCSDACRLVRHPRRSKTCEFCSREFSTYDNHARYCSRSCARKDKVGEDATNWKGGVAAHRLRSQFGGDKLAKWRGAVYARDGYACQKCGATGALNAHREPPLEAPGFNRGRKAGQPPGWCIPARRNLSL